MSGPDGVGASRREFLAGKGHADQSALRAEPDGGTEIPQAGDTVSIQTRAMTFAGAGLRAACCRAMPLGPDPWPR